MNPFTFENSTKVYFGTGCVAQNLPRLLADCGPKVLLGYGGGSIKKNGIYAEVTRILAAGGKTVTEFNGIGANPTYGKVQEGVELVKKQGIDFILAVGGGSVMDCCKAVALSARCGGNAWERFWTHRGQIDFTPVPLGVIVTLPATGSEVNGNAVITNEAARVKTDRDYPQCNAKFALLDPTYTYTLPTDQLTAGGFDILSHIMETYFSKPDQDNVSDSISEALMSSVIRNLRLARLNPNDYAARSNLMWCASMAENRIIKLGKELDFQCHQIEHQLSASKIKLVRLLGIEPELPEGISWHDTVIPASVALSGLDKNPMMLNLQSKVRAAEYEAESIKSSALPQVNWVISKSTAKDSNGNEAGWYTGLNVEWEAFSGGSQRAAETSARAKANMAQQQYEVSYKDLEYQINYQIQVRDSSFLRADDYDRLTSETDRVRRMFYEQWYHLGKRTLLDVLTAENDHFNNQLSAINNRYDGYISNINVIASASMLLSWMKMS